MHADVECCSLSALLRFASKSELNSIQRSDQVVSLGDVSIEKGASNDETSPDDVESGINSSPASCDNDVVSALGFFCFF